MVSLYELIQSAHKSARESVNGKPVDFIHLNNPVDYRRNNEKTLEITANFDRTFQNLQGVSVNVIDRDVSEFTEEELKSFVSFISNPFYLSFECSDPKSLNPYHKIFELVMVDHGPIMAANFKSENEGSTDSIRLRPTESGEHMVVDYDVLGRMFGLDFKGKSKDSILQLLGKIDTSKTHETYKWAFVRGFSQYLFLSSRDKKRLHLHSIISSYEDSLTNNFTLECEIDYSYPSRSVIMDQVNTIEKKLRTYRGTELPQVPFNIWRCGVVTDRPGVPNFRTILRKSSGIKDAISNVIEYASKNLKSETVYPDIPVVVNDDSSFYGEDLTSKP